MDGIERLQNKIRKEAEKSARIERRNKQSAIIGRIGMSTFILLAIAYLLIHFKAISAPEWIVDTVTIVLAFTLLGTYFSMTIAPFGKPSEKQITECSVEVLEKMKVEIDEQIEIAKAEIKEAEEYLTELEEDSVLIKGIYK